MNNVFTSARSRGIAMKSAVAGVLLAPVFANADMSAAITAAQTEGTTNVGLAITAVIAVAALGLGISMVLGLIKR